jgi:hypothetical protein
MADARSELREISRFGGNAQKNSGRGKHKKGDATLGPFTVDVKEYAKSYSISRTNWAKICTDAAKNSNEPALMLALGEGQQTTRVWVVGDQMFKEMLSAWEEKYGE